MDKVQLAITLTGTSQHLSIAASKIRAAAGESEVEMKSQIKSLPGAKGKKSAALTLAFYHLHPDNTPEKILELVHRASHCDIGAVITANVSEIRGSQKSSDEDDQHLYQPSADITISHPDKAVRKVVAQYLRQRLDKIFEDKYLYNGVGQIGLPHECFEEGALMQHNGQHEKIYMTFRDAESSNKSEANLAATAASEHVSGLLGIGERLTGHDKFSWEHRN